MNTWLGRNHAQDMNALMQLRREIEVGPISYIEIVMLSLNLEMRYRCPPPDP